MKKIYFKPGTEMIDLIIENVILAGSENDQEEVEVPEDWTPGTINGGGGPNNPKLEEEEW